MTQQYRFEQFFALRRTFGFTPMPDGESLLIPIDTTGNINLWRVPVDGGAPEQLTLFERETVLGTACSADGSMIALTVDANGGEDYQIYLLKTDGGWPEPLTDAPGVQHRLGGFSPDGQYLSYCANDPEARQHMNVYLHDLQTSEVRMVCGGGGAFFHGLFSPDGRYLLLPQFHTNANQDLWLVDLLNGERRNLVPHPDRQMRILPAFWEPGGQSCWFVTNDGREFLGLARYNLAQDTWAYRVTADWDVERSALSPDGRLLAYCINEAGSSLLKVVDLQTGAELPLPTIPRGAIYQLDFAGTDRQRRIIMQMATYGSTSTAFVLDLDQGELRQVTQNMLGRIPAEAFVEPALVHITAEDGQQIPAWLYKPLGVQPDQRVPAILSIHGGPDFQERPVYMNGGLYQYLLNRGIAILAPNIRGSTGFGQAYQTRLYRDWGGVDLQDIKSCAEYLRNLSWVDPARLGVFGGSYGGFATLTAATRLPDTWACAVSLNGPTNLVTWAQRVPPAWRPMIPKWIGDPVTEQDFLLERSPITYLPQLRCPLLMVQGGQDPRVPQAEADQFVEKARTLGKEVEYLVLPDEGHTFTRRPNQLKVYGAVADFLVEHLIG